MWLQNRSPLFTVIRSVLIILPNFCYWPHDNSRRDDLMRKKISDVQTERERNMAEWKLDLATKRAHQEQSMISVTPEHLHQWVCLIQNNNLKGGTWISTEIHKQYLCLRDKPQQLQSLIFICRTVIPQSPLAIFYPCKALYCSWKDHWSIVNPHQNSFSKALQIMNPVISSQTLSNSLLQAHIRGHVPSSIFL